MAYKISARRYNARMNKIFEIYEQQQKEKDIIAHKVYGKSYENLSNKRKGIINNIWGDKKGIN